MAVNEEVARECLFKGCGLSMALAPKLGHARVLRIVRDALEERGRLWMLLLKHLDEGEDMAPLELSVYSHEDIILPVTTLL